MRFFFSLVIWNFIFCILYFIVWQFTRACVLIFILSRVIRYELEQWMTSWSWLYLLAPRFLAQRSFSLKKYIITTIFVSKYSVRGSTTTRTTTTTIAHVCCSFEQYLFYDYKWKTSETRVMTPHAVFIVGYFVSFENLINKINDHRKFNVHNKTQIINTLILSAYDSKVLTIYNSLLLQFWSLSQNPDPMSEWVSEWRVSVYYLSPLSWEKTNDYHMWEYTSRIDLSIWLHVERWKRPIWIEQKHGRKDVNCSFAGSLCLSICLLVCSSMDLQIC